MASAPAVLQTPLNRVELANAVFQQVIQLRLTLTEAQLAWSDFERDWEQGIWIAVDFPYGAWDACVNLAKQYSSAFGVRTLDSLHVACALELKAQKFWTFDERQARPVKQPAWTPAPSCRDSGSYLGCFFGTTEVVP
jgi:predicted nucleic acid-binding protein